MSIAGPASSVTPSVTSSGPTTVGQALKASPAVKAAVDTIVVARPSRPRRESLGVAPPRAELKQSYDDLMARFAAVRGGAASGIRTSARARATVWSSCLMAA